MIAKIGLPSKPSMRGGNWVVDASHCQGCSQQFTFINRKHHCRRCGGLFCNGCTQQRMVLRGQGDSAVRICDPCKEIEEAARFELRYGQRNRGAKSNTKPVAKNEDELLKELLDDDKLASKPVRKFRHDKNPDLQRDTSSLSGSSLQDSSVSSERVENIIKSMSTGGQNNVPNKVPSSSPEELRRLAVEEKSKSKLLKAEGKSREAYAAFKRGKELEKQAAALEITSSSSSSSIPDRAVSSEGVENIVRSISTGAEINVLNDLSSSNPEELRRLAIEEKSKHRLLKAEGKSEEALAAFKRGKELEKQAAALEISIRKSRRLASAQKATDDHIGIIDRGKVSVNMTKTGKDDLTNELRELGWSDADLHDADKKQEPVSLEGELSSLLREIPRKPHSGHASNGTDMSQVVALKKKALMLKREGKLAEAKEELKRAKILEKQLEEQELLAGAEDSDDELSALIHSMDSDKQENLLSDLSEPGVKIDIFTNLGDDLALDGNFDVTDDDMNDPEIAAALKSFGWSEEDDHPTENISQSTTKNLSAEILSLKKEAINQKRAGNMVEARELLRKAKLLENDLAVSDGNIGDFEPSLALNFSKPQFSEKETTPVSHSEENMAPTGLLDHRRPIKTKLAIQKELLALKRNALALRRKGRTEEAEEELRKGKSLEQQLEEMEKPQTFVVSKVSLDDSNIQESQSRKPASTKLGSVKEADDVEVTEQDMQDPALLSVLENLGWKDDLESSKTSKLTADLVSSKASKLTADPSENDSANLKRSVKSTKRKGDLQRELLGIKRKALALRRQGKTEEADEELRKAKGLEDQLEELDSGHQLDSHARNSTDSFAYSFHKKEPEVPIMSQDKLKTDMQNKDSDPPSLIDSSSDIITYQTENSNGSKPALSLGKNRAEIQKELSDIERKSLALRGQEKIDEFTEESSKSKDLENQHVKMEVEQPFHATENNFDKLNLQTADKKSENLTAGHMIKDLNELQKNKGTGTEVSDGSSNDVSYSIKLPKTSSATEDWPVSETNVKETVPIKPIPSQIMKINDLLSGDGLDEKNDIPFPATRHDQITEKSNPIFSDSSLHLDSQPVNVQTGVSCKENLSNRQDYGSDMVTKGVAAVQSLAEEVNPTTGIHSTKDQVLELKRKAVTLKKEGKMAEALAELKQAKLLEKSLGESSQKESAAIRTDPVSLIDYTSAQNSQKVGSPPQKPMSSRERFKLQQESLAHKRQALKLRREGKMEESEALFELAKKLEAQIQEADGISTNISLKKEDESLVEDFLDPQLMSALKAIGWDEKDITPPAPAPKLEVETKNMISGSRKTNPVQEIKPNANAPAVPSELQARTNKNSTDISKEKSLLEEQIKSEKVRALNLKRAGRQSDALAALRSAKRLEKKLESLSS